MLVRPTENTMKIMSMRAVGRRFIKEQAQLRDDSKQGQMYLVRDGEDPAFVVLPYKLFVLVQGYIAAKIEGTH